LNVSAAYTLELPDDGHGERRDIILVPHPSNDPNDPLNWSPKKKLYHLAIVGFYTFFSGALMSGTISGWAYTTADTGITTTQLNYGYAISILFCGVANFPWTIVANCYGRRTVYLICSFGAMLSSIWTAEFNTLGSYYAKCVFVGSFTAPFEGMTMTIVGDLYFLHERGLYMALVL
jgi:MFS family permease